MAVTAGSEQPPILQTIETRWFSPGSAPGDVLAWFDALVGQADDQPARRDFYLHPIRDDGLGVKVREAGLEVKQRRESFGLIRFGPSVSGLVERWVKWRFPLDESQSARQSFVTGDSAWLAVDKERRLKHFQFSTAGALQTVLAPAEINSGQSKDGGLVFHLELAQVRIGDRHFWTIGYEANWAGQNSPERLRAAVALQVRDGTPERLLGSNSFGYPHWLATYLN